MKFTKRFKLLLTPVLISVLSLLMIVTTFAWYKASAGILKSEDGQANVSVRLPEGLNAEVTRLGDKCDSTKYPDCTNYKFDKVNQSYKVNKQTSSKDSFDGYFGQTALGDHTIDKDRDKPYICFYEVEMSGYLKQALTITNAFVQSVVITKLKTAQANPNKVLFNNTSKPWTFQNSEFSIDFYDCVDPSASELEFKNPHSNLNLNMQQGNNLGSKFYFGLKYQKRNSKLAFKFSSIDYIDTTFNFSLKFDYKQTV